MAEPLADRPHLTAELRLVRATVLAEALPRVPSSGGQPLPGGLQQLLGAGDLFNPVRVPLFGTASGRRLRGAVAGPAVAVPVYRARVPVDLEDRGGDPLQEAAVVGDRDDGAAVRAQALLEPVHGHR